MGGLRLVLGIVALSILTQPSAAQQFPAKPITMVVPTRPAAMSMSPRAYCRRRSAIRSVSQW